MFTNNLINSPHLTTIIILSIGLTACGGSNSADVSEPQTMPDPAPQTTGISAIRLNDIQANSAGLSFTTSELKAAEITVWPKGTEFAAKNFATSSGQSHNVQITGLWADVQWQARIKVGAISETISFKTAQPDWPGTCREGKIKLPIQANDQWQTYTDNNGSVQFSATNGCKGQSAGIHMTFSLGDGEWVVAARESTFNEEIDLTNMSHLWVPYKGTPDVPVAFEVKLRDHQGNLSVVRLDGGASLPVWRSWAIDLREFESQVGHLDLSNITSIEFAFSLSRQVTGQRHGTVEVGDIWAWQINDFMDEHTEFEKVLPNPLALTAIAADLLARQQTHGFIPAWFELTPNWHLYANAMALIVFTLEYERLLESDPLSAGNYLQGARKLADALVRLQRISDRNGAWDDSFNVINHRLVLKPSSNRVMWVGSTAWAGIALILARDILPDGARFEPSITQASQYYQQSQLCRKQAGLPVGSITEGTEGNISSHLFWQAAVERDLTSPEAAHKLKTFIADHLFDAQQQRFFCGVKVDFGAGYNEQSCTLAGSGEVIKGHALACLDVVGNWGTQWLVRNGRVQDGFTGLSFARAIFPTTDFGERGIRGLGDITGPWAPTVEHGAGQWAAEGGRDANFVMNQAHQHLCSSGKCRGASDDFSAGIGWNTRAHGIAPSAWMYLAWHGEFWQKL